MTLLLPVFSTYGQSPKDRTILGKVYAQEELNATLADTKGHNVVDHKTILVKDSLMAVTIAEPLLFSIYGKDNIIQQRPYETYSIDGYWIIIGSLLKNHKGGTFLLILDARDSRILKITHGK